MPLYRTAGDVANYIRRRGKKTMYITKRIADLSDFNVPSAGPRPNITGMRNLTTSMLPKDSIKHSLRLNLTFSPHKKFVQKSF